MTDVTVGTMTGVVEAGAPRHPARPGRPRRRTLQHVGTVVVAVAAVAYLLPRIAGLGWGGIAAGVVSVAPPVLLALVAVWFAGLAVHTIALAGALPGLTHRQALTLSLTGSAVANVLPLGGAAGVALNGYMCRAWGFAPRQFAVYTAVTNVWDVGAKLVLMTVAATVLVVSGLGGPPRVEAAAGAVGVLALLVLAWGVWAPTGARVVAGALDGIARGVRRVVGRGPVGLGARLVAAQRDCRGLVAHRWQRLTVSVAAYHVLLAVLLGTCLEAVGAEVSVGVVVVALAAERLLGLLSLTPGGLGVVEVGLTGVLIALGADPVTAVAAALLYRALTFGLEIPVGGTLLLGWWLARRHAATARVARVARAARPS